MSKDEKRQEIEDYINGKVCSAEIIVLVQHFCIETWALGNQKACSANPTTHPLIAYKRYFDVRQNDPELLLPWSSLELNRAQFAYKYLRAMLSDKYIRLSYKKGKPDVLTNKGYFNQIVSRYNRTGHINSFEVFIQAFSNP